MLTPESFAELVASLRRMGERGKRAPGPDKYPQYAQQVTVREAARLTGYKADTLRQYERRAARKRAHGSEEPYRIPTLGEDRTWRVFDLALWRAGYPVRSAALPRPKLRNPGRPAPSDEAYMPAVREILEAEKDDVATLTVDNLQEMLAGRRIYVDWYRARRMLLAAKGPPVINLAPQRADGLATTAELARAYGITSGAITRQKERGRLTPARYDDRGGIPIPLYDPAKIMHPGGTRRSPVDKGNDERNRS